MGEIIGVVTGAIGLAKQITEWAKSSKDAEAKLAAAELMLQLAEVKVKVAELLEENSNLKESLKKATSAIPDVTFKDGLYYKPDGDGPFCVTCYDSQNRLIRLTPLPYHEARITNHRSGCGVCKSTYKQELPRR